MVHQKEEAHQAGDILTDENPGKFHPRSAQKMVDVNFIDQTIFVELKNERPP
ncbi:hypothetical protein [Streptomyces cellulosae]|uniref:Uncharacterized protein n=1 Tax=Streptomyces cellulosae TaxID=1968 RepID=A0ABW7Y719_STRCE